MPDQPRVLCVDDDANVLASLTRTLRRAFDVHTEVAPLAALECIRRAEPFAVVVSDLRMPGMDGLTFLSAVRSESPDSARILLTGAADLEVAIKAINDGNIFRFLRKPCPPDVLSQSIQSGARQFELVSGERVLLAKTLNGCVQMLMEVLSISNQAAFGRAAFVRKIASGLARELRLGDPWSVEVAAMLSQVGAIALPTDVLQKSHSGAALTPEEHRMVNSIPSVAIGLIRHIPRMESVIDILAGLQPARHRSDLPLANRILRTTLEYIRLDGAADPEAALAHLSTREAEFGRDVLDALRTITNPEGHRYEERSVSIRELRPEMTLLDDVVSASGLLVVAKGHEISTGLLARVRNFAERMTVLEPVRVRVPVRDPRPEREEARSATTT